MISPLTSSFLPSQETELSRLARDQQSIEIFNGLRCFELSACATFEQAINKCGSASPNEFNQCLVSHRRRANRLAQRIAELGGEPLPFGAIWEPFRQLLASDNVRFSRTSARTVLKECESAGIDFYQQTSTDIDPDSCWMIQMELLPEQQKTQAWMLTLPATGK